jgi:ketosteroid isomerase-like protein
MVRAIPLKERTGNSLKARFEAANATWIDFFNKDDFAGVASLYTEDASAFPPGSGIVKGRAATIEALWKSMAEHWRVVTQNECLARPTPGRRPTSRPSTR